jgi:enterochelin esterase-like enzyme
MKRVTSDSFRPAALCVIGLLLAFGPTPARADDAKPASSNVPGAEYPKVHPDGRVTFRLRAPDAKRVQLKPGGEGRTSRGADNGLGKNVFDMERGADGYWTVTTPPAVPGLHTYWFVVDGVIVNDPGSEVYFAEHYSSAVEVPATGVDFYDVKDVPHGEVRALWYHSKVRDIASRVMVYTPPGYEKGTERYPVLYLQHGSNEDDRAWTSKGRANFILDNLIAAKKCKPMIVVMGNGKATKTGVPSTMGDYARFESVLTEELIPLVDATYRTLADRDHRAIAGASMGGIQSLQFGFRHLDQFSSICAISAPVFGRFDVKTAYDKAFADADAVNKKVRLLWLGVGSVEAFTDGVKGMHAALDEAGIKHVFFESQGTAHEWQTARRSLHDFAPRLFQGAAKGDDKKSAKADVTGTWKAEVEVGGTIGEPEFTLKQDGDKITGKYKGLLGELDVTGKVEANTIEFEFTTDQGKVVYTGTIDKDAMKGEVKYGDLTGTWTAKRQTAKAETEKTPAASPAANYTRTEDVIYGRKHGVALTMDVLAPKGKANGRGIIFCVSGGWFSSKDSINPLIVQWFLKEFLDRGYTVFAVVHGSQPRFTIPEALDDMHRAVRFIKANAKTYGVDPDKLGITGGSAGGHLSLMQGCAPKDGNPKATDPVERESSRVAAVACFYPPTDFLNYGKEGEVALGTGTLKDFKAPFDFHEFDGKTKSFVPVTDEAKRRAIGRQISPVYAVTKDAAPALIVHGDADKLVPIQQAEVMVARLKDAGVPAELVVKKGQAHGWPGIDKDSPTLADWFDMHLLGKK